jgi:glutamate:Na+ symporter, ESS family
VFELDLIQTLAFGGVVLLAGYGLRRLVPVFARYNLPAPVLGGLIVSIVILLARSRGVTLFQFDTSLQSPLMIAFFTTVGFGASLPLLRIGGPQVLRFFAIAAVFVVVQNVVGILVALALGMSPLFGVLAGSVTMTGGPATALAFAPLFEQSGVVGAATVGVAAAMAGIVLGGVFGGPVATLLIERNKLPHPRSVAGTGAVPDATDASPSNEEMARVVQHGDEPDPLGILKNLVAILVAMWIGGWVSSGFAALGITLPAYIGAMLVAAVIRNLDNVTDWFGLSEQFIAEFGAVSLSLFLAIALMTLKLWELAGLAIPLLVIVLVQMLLAGLVAGAVVFRMMGRDYESAVMSGGFVGFTLGTTANAMAVMRALVEKFGAAPRAFLVAPIVGAFFIDFTNALIITVFLNVFG